MPKSERPRKPHPHSTRTEIIRLLEKKGVAEIEEKPLRDCYTYELLKVVKCINQLGDRS